MSPQNSSSSPKNSFFTILVVDGISKDPSFFAESLQAEGQFVLRAESAKDAILKTRTFHPDMILLGCDFLEMSCLELLPKLLLIKPDTAVVMVASHPSIQITVAAMKLGAVDFLEMPVDTRKLHKDIEEQKALFHE